MEANHRAIMDLRRRIEEGRSIRKSDLSLPLRPHREEALEHLAQEGIVYKDENGWHVAVTGGTMARIRIRCPRGCNNPSLPLTLDPSVSFEFGGEDDPYVVFWCQCCGKPVQVSGLDPSAGLLAP